MKDEHKYGKKMARNGPTTVIYKGTFVSNQSLLVNSLKRYQKQMLLGLTVFAVNILKGIYW